MKPGPQSTAQILKTRFRRLLGIESPNHRSSEATVYRPTGEALEPKTLLSDVTGWSGGTGGITSSLITPSNIATLSQKYTQLLDAPIIAEPLFAEVNVTTGPTPGPQEVVLAATENDTLCAFNAATGSLEWQKSLLGPGETPIPESVSLSGLNGITSTPVIDRSTNTIYVCTAESYVAGKVDHYTRTIHAINLSDGTERTGSPVVIADSGYVRGRLVSAKGPSVAGRGAGSVGGRIFLQVPKQLQRPGLTLDGNNLVIAFGWIGHGGPYHGWILTYNTTTLRRTGVFNDTPGGSAGGIWMNGNPVQVDSQGYLYTETGNGTFDTKLNRAEFPSHGDYGECVLKLQIVPGYRGPNGTGIKVVDFFAPQNAAQLGKTDGDLASSGVLILPDGMGGSAHPNLLLASAKSGIIFVINRDAMGRFHQPADQIVQELPGALTKSFDTPTVFDGTIYYGGVGQVLTAYRFQNGQLVQTGKGPDVLSYPGASPVVSSNGTEDGIIWVISAKSKLIAYDPGDLTTDLWSASLPLYSKFSIPAISSDGHIAVGAGNILVGFGLNPSPPPGS
jgi:hypothetical protein